MTIAPKGGITSLKTIMTIIDKKLAEHQANDGLPPDRQRHSERDHVLIIENPKVESKNTVGHYWDELLRGIKIANFEDRNPNKREFVDFNALAQHYGIYITETREQTIALAKSLAPKLEKPAARVPTLPKVPDNSIIFVATGTDKKFRELERLYKTQGINVSIRSIYHLVDRYVSPKERSGTYEGNVAEKVSAGINQWESMPVGTKNKILQTLGKEFNVSRTEIEKRIFILGKIPDLNFTTLTS